MNNQQIQTISGTMNGAGLQCAIVMSEFNSTIVEKLLDGAVDGLLRHGVSPEHIEVIKVPGAVELPLVAQTTIQNRPDISVVICLGAIIRGETAHFDYVASQCASGVQQVALSTGIPVIFGVLTTNNIEQALQRCGIKGQNSGWSAAVSAIHMATVLDRVKSAYQQ